MNTNNSNSPQVTAELKALQQQLLSMAGIVESVFADAVVGLVEGDFNVASEVRLEDYKAHQTWLRAESLCVDLLSSGELSLEDVRFTAAALKIGQNLRRMADEAVQISSHIKACSAGDKSSAPSYAMLSRMVEITQSVFGSSIEALVNRDAALAQGLHLVFPELASLNRTVILEVIGEGKGEKPPAEVGVALVLVARALESISAHVLDVANAVHHLYRYEANGEPAEEVDQ